MTYILNRPSSSLVLSSAASYLEAPLWSDENPEHERAALRFAVARLGHELKAQVDYDAREFLAAVSMLTPTEGGAVTGSSERERGMPDEDPRLPAYASR